MSRSKTFEWCKRFKNGRTLVQDTPGRGGSEPTAVVSVNIQRVERLILENRRITCRQLVEQTHLSVGTLNTIIHEHLQFRIVHVGFRDSSLPSTGREDCKSATSYENVLIVKASLFSIRSSPVTKRGCIISPRNRNAHQGNGSMWTQQPPKNC